MLTIRDDPYHSVLVRYIDSRQGGVRYDLFFIHDRHTELIPTHGCYVSGLAFPKACSWIRHASRVLVEKPRDYGRGWFRWDEPIRTRDDIPCRSVSSRMIDIVC